MKNNTFNYRIIPLGNSIYTALVDEEDYEDLNRYKWQIHKHGYAQRSSRKEKIASGDPATVMMHRQILGLTPTDNNIHVDHIYGRKRDNRKSQLRAGTIADNNRNTAKQSNNKSGIKGVCSVKGSKKWKAKIHQGGKDIYLGLFSNIKDAEKARLDAEKKLGWIPATNI